MKQYLYLLFLPFVLMILLLGGRCGTIGFIEGGPKDSTSPHVVYTTPDSAAVLVPTTQKKITLSFNEFVQLNNANQILINPIPPKNPPIISANLKNITLFFDTALYAPITYTFDFKNFIGDLNENNRMPQYFFLFSTGDAIDTASLDGRVFSAVTARLDTLSQAVLYPAQNFYDSAVYKKKPLYITPIDGKGYFHFRYLRPGNYHVFILNDKDNNYLYSSPSEAFDFLDSPIHTYFPSQKPEKEPFFFSSFVAPLPPRKSPTRKRHQGKLLLSYDIVPEKVLLRDSSLIIRFYDSIGGIDSTRMILTDTTALKDSTAKRKNYITHIQLRPQSEDSTFTEAVITAPLPTNATYALILKKGFVPDSTKGFMLKNDTITLEMLSARSYRNVHFICPSCRQLTQPILQIKSKETILHTLHLKDSLFVTPLLKIGTYEIHLFEDINENGKQDAVDFATRTHAERTFLLDKPTIIINTASKDKYFSDKAIEKLHPPPVIERIAVRSFEEEIKEKDVVKEEDVKE